MVGDRVRRASPLFGVFLGVQISLAALLALGLAIPILMLACAVPLGLLLMQRPQRGVLLLASLVPFHGLLLIAPLPVWTRAWKEALVVVTLLATFFAPADARSRPRPLPGWVPALVGLFGLALLSGIGVGAVQAAVGLKITFFYVLVGVAVWRCPLDHKERDWLVSILMLLGVVTASWGLAQQLLGAARLNELGYDYNTTIRTTQGLLRSFSTFNQPFPFGFFLMLVLLVGLPHALDQPKRLRSKLFVLSMPILGLGLASSFVRGAWIGTAVGLIYLGFSRYRVLLLGVPLVAVSFLFLPTDLSAAALGSASGMDRLDSWRENIAQIMSHPTGIGLGASGSASEKAAELGVGLPTYQPDNYYFKILYEFGVLGLWFFVLLLVAVFSSTRRSSGPSDGPGATFAVAVGALVLAVAAASIVSTYLEIFPMEFYFWLLLAVVESCDPVPASA